MNVYERMNESQGGVAERFKKHREASAYSEAGVVFRMKTKRKTTPAASALVASRNFLMTQPPLLAVMQGGDYLLDSNLFTAVYDVYGRRYSLCGNFDRRRGHQALGIPAIDLILLF